MARRDRRPRKGPQKGFTLVEILIVVVILAILAAIVIPQFTSAAAESRDNSLKMDVHRIRQMIEIYYIHHDSQYPTLADFEAQMTGVTDSSGNIVAQPPGTAGTFGPYIERIPVNPNTSNNTIGAGAVGTSDWYYDETTGDFHANESAASRAF